MTEIKKSIPERSAATQMLIDTLGVNKDPDKIFAYSELAAMIHEDLAGLHGPLTSARHVLIRERGINYVTLRREGIRLAKPGDAVSIGKHGLAGIHRASKRTLNKMSCTVYEELTNDEKISFNAHSSALGAMHVLTDSRSVAKIARICEDKKDKLLLADTLKAFGI